MRFALVGIDDELLRLAAAAAADGHVVTQAFELGSYGPQLRDLFPGAKEVKHWESLLVGETADCVLVGTGLPTLVADDPVSPLDRRGEQLRRFVQEGLPVALLPFACDLDQGYELEMYRRDLNGMVRMWYWDWNHAGYRWLQSLLQQTDDSPLGNVQEVRWDARMTTNGVRARLVADVAQLRRWLGPIDRVLATGPGGGAHYDPFAPKGDMPPLERLTVHLSGRTSCSAVWSIVPTLREDLARITLVGTAGEAILIVGESQQEWHGIVRVGRKEEDLTFPPAEIPWREFVQAGKAKDDSLPAWLDSCRDLEVIEALDRSLVRGRTVGVHAEETTEAEAFKGAMASGGCITLVLVLLALFGVVLVEGLRLPVRTWFIWKAWPALLVLLILSFLCLQLLHVLVKQRSPEKG